jgi:hypothetical protein
MIRNESHAEDVAAAYAWTVIEEIAKLPPSEGYQRLYNLFHTALLAYAECQNGWGGWGLGPEPSEN